MAPKDRVTPDSLTYERQGDSTILRPQANPVNTFVKPTEPLKSTLVDVAQALAQVQPKLERYATEKAHEEAVNDIRTAEATAMASSAATWDEAIQKGEVPAGASPLYQRVFEETRGKSNGLTEAQANVWQKWVSPDNAIRTTQDPKVISEWFAERRKELVAGKNPDWVKGFMPAFNQVQQQLTQKIIGDNVKYIEQANHDALGQLFTGRILEGVASGKSHAQIAAQLADDSLPQRFAGLQGREINRIAASAIISAAQKTGRTDLLQVGYQDRPDLKNPGGTIKGVFTIPEFAMQATSAETSILSKANAAETRNQLAENRAEKRVFKDMQGEWLAKRAEDPTWEPDLEWKKRWTKAGGSIRGLRSEMDADIKPPKVTDPATLVKITGDYVDMVRSGRDATPAIQALADAGMPMPQLLHLHKENDKGADALFRSRVYAVQDDTLKNMVDRLTKSLDGPAAMRMVGQSRTELAQFALEEQRRMSGSGQPIDPRKLEDLIVQKSTELQDRMIRANEGPPVDPNAKGANKPGAQGKQGAQQQSGGPTSTANAIPVDRIVDPSPATQGYQFPAATATTSTGMQITSTWEPPPGANIDIREINLLRTNPLALNSEGVPFWRRFDEIYGVGASRYFNTNSQREINVFLDRQRSARMKGAQDAIDRARNVPSVTP